MQGRKGDTDYTDFRMSEKFGFDWWKQDARRMAKFIHIMRFEGEEQGRSQKKQPSEEKKFRPRNARR